jgi:acetoacetyl-CoA synthetase
MSQIADAICVGQRRKADTDERVLLFVKLNPGSVLDASFVAHISSAIENKFSRRYVPRHIFEVDDIPYTLNGKKCELNVKQIVSGLKGSVSGTVANPECLGLYEKYARLRDDGSVAPVEVAKL